MHCSISALSPGNLTRLPSHPPRPKAVPSITPRWPTTATAINPNFLLRRVTNVPPNYKRFDGTAPIVGEPLVKTRFPLSRLAWITYKGPSAAVYALNNNDPVITGLLNAGVSLSMIQAGTAANIKTCFGLCFGSTCTGTVGDPSNPWTYTNPTGPLQPIGSCAWMKWLPVGASQIFSSCFRPEY